jgi:hypothetical protein
MNCAIVDDENENANHANAYAATRLVRLHVTAPKDRALRHRFESIVEQPCVGSAGGRHETHCGTVAPAVRRTLPCSEYDIATQSGRARRDSS